MSFNTPISHMSDCLRPCGRFAAQAGAVTATASFASMSMRRWKKRRSVIVAAPPYVEQQQILAVSNERDMLQAGCE